MKRCTGIDGVFFEARDAKALRAYQKHLELNPQSWGMTFHRQTPEGFMSDFRVDNLKAVQSALEAEGSTVVIDPESSQLELWQPPAGRRKG